MLTKIFVTFFAGILGFLGAGLIAVFQGGVATVSVQQEGLSIYLPVPMNLIGLAVHFIPEEELEKVQMEAEEFRDLVTASLEGLVVCEDAVFVEVESQDERVHVEKKEGYLIVHVESEMRDEQVDVRIPLDSLDRIVRTVLIPDEVEDTATAM